MENEEGQKVDLYIPRKCSVTHRIITAKDHGSVQINVPKVNKKGVIVPGKYTTFAVSGGVRTGGASDHSINVICTKKGFLKHVLPKNMVL
ncbi:40S ribosomal protein S21 [Pelomyxa schiedti]|nr:40S ribosomal protein S21 [Pelomyxa schiedti]